MRIKKPSVDENPEPEPESSIASEFAISGNGGGAMRGGAGFFDFLKPNAPTPPMSDTDEARGVTAEQEAKAAQRVGGGGKRRNTKKDRRLAQTKKKY